MLLLNKHGKIPYLVLPADMKKGASLYEIQQVILKQSLGHVGNRTVSSYLNRFGEDEIIATFHTHPNIGNNYRQEPSETDKRAVRDDPDLKGKFYVGEFVISKELIYLILPNGQVSEIGYRWEILG